MKFFQANKIQRFLTYFIDMLIISFFVSIFSSLIYMLINYDSQVVLNLTERLTNDLLNYLEGNGTIDTIKNTLKQVLKYSLLEFGIDAVLYLILVIVYFVVIPKFWSNQTIGRLIMKTKVIRKDGSELTTKTLIMREIVGTYILYCLIGGILIIISAALVLIDKGVSLVDKISGTNLISIKSDDLIRANEKPVDSIDAKVEEVKSDDKFKESKLDDEFAIDDDEYRII